MRRMPGKGTGVVSFRGGNWWRAENVDGRKIDAEFNSRFHQGDSRPFKLLAEINK